MSHIRDHHVAGQPPKFSRYAQEFKHLDGSAPVDWRAPRRPMATRRPRRTLRRRVADVVVRLFEAVRAIPGGEPSNWRDAAVFGIGAAWGGMIAIGILLAIAARHAP